MAKNDYLAKKRATERAFFDAGLQMGRQQIIDMLCLVLHDPEVIGKDTFGRERLNKVVAAIGKMMGGLLRSTDAVPMAPRMPAPCCMVQHGELPRLWDTRR